MEQVICQIRFPQVLRIATQLPDAFQERIRSSYPLFKHTMQQLPPEVAALFGGPLLSLASPMPRYEFTSSDSEWTVSLAADFLALTCRNYERWEVFRQHFQGPFEALQQEYSPTFYTRIGLRYRDVIRRSILGLVGVPWADLLQAPVAGELSSGIAKSVISTKCDTVVELGERLGRVRVQHGLVDKENEVCYVIDSDFFTEERTEAGNVLPQLDRFNRRAGHLFRWCITETLHDAMGPHDPAVS
ncbi:MAG: TIGR04255 family protein [Armatimonadetes bacterium]|nr:TIGR04255 family protein [Armatimonadota bacterium]